MFRCKIFYVASHAPAVIAGGPADDLVECVMKARPRPEAAELPDPFDTERRRVEHFFRALDAQAPDVPRQCRLFGFGEDAGEVRGCKARHPRDPRQRQRLVEVSAHERGGAPHAAIVVRAPGMQDGLLYVENGATVDEEQIRHRRRLRGTLERLLERGSLSEQEAAELLLALAITNKLRRRLPHRVWRSAHYINFPVWLLATLHGLGSGTDRHTLWLLGLELEEARELLGLDD